MKRAACPTRRFPLPKDTMSVLFVVACRLTGYNRSKGARHAQSEGMRHMNDNQLRYFRALYELRNAHQAALSIPLSRQGLLKSLDSLEVELGVRLFDDKTIPVCTSTAYGNALYAYTVRQQGMVRDLQNEFKRIAMSESGVVSLGAAIGTMGLLGLGVIKEFELAHEGVRIVYDEVPDLRCDEGLANGSYTVALTVHPYHQQFETRELYSTDRFIWVSVKDPLSHRSSIALEDLSGYHVGVVGQSFKNHPELVRKSGEQGVAFASVDAFSEMTQLYRYAMKPGFASFTVPNVVGLFSDLFDGRDEPVRAVRIEGFPWRFGISRALDHEPSALEAAFIEHCAEYAAKRFGA